MRFRSELIVFGKVFDFRLSLEREEGEPEEVDLSSNTEEADSISFGFCSAK